MSPRDDSGTGGDQARGTAPAKSEREGVGTSDMRGVGNGQPGLRGSAFGAKGQRHTAEKPTLPLPVVPRREQVLPRIVLFKKLRRLFYLLSGRFLQPLFSGLRGSVSPWYLHRPLGTPYPWWLRGTLTCRAKYRRLTLLC